MCSTRITSPSFITLITKIFFFNIYWNCNFVLFYRTRFGGVTFHKVSESLCKEIHSNLCFGPSKKLHWVESFFCCSFLLCFCLCLWLFLYYTFAFTFVTFVGFFFLFRVEGFILTEMKNSNKKCYSFAFCVFLLWMYWFWNMNRYTISFFFFFFYYYDSKKMNVTQP